MNSYDLVIIGSGPAGLTAGLYAGRAKLNTLILEKEKIGGQITSTASVENYPGAMENDSGITLIEKMKRQIDRQGISIAYDSIIDAKLKETVKTLTGKTNTYFAKTVIIATGASPKHLGCKGENELTGHGVSYCATCDGSFFDGLDIYVVGGGDAAVEEALYLTRYGRKVTVIHRRDSLRAAKSIQEKAFANPRISFIWDSAVIEIKGDGLVEGMMVKNLKTGKITEIVPKNEETFGLFIFVGMNPQTSLFKGTLETENGYLVTDEDMKTNVDGVFAAGDVRKKSLRQIVTAVSDGAIAATQAAKYLESVR